MSSRFGNLAHDTGGRFGDLSYEDLGNIVEFQGGMQSVSAISGDLSNPSIQELQGEISSISSLSGILSGLVIPGTPGRFGNLQHPALGGRFGDISWAVTSTFFAGTIAGVSALTGDIFNPTTQEFSGEIESSSVLHGILVVDRAISYEPATFRPGVSLEIDLEGVWDADNKLAYLNSGEDTLSATIIAEDSTSVTIVIPTLHEENSTLVYTEEYSIAIEDSVGSEEALITILPPDDDLFIWSITGSPWDQGSIFYQSEDLSNGDSAIVEIISGTITSLSSSGTIISDGSVRLQAKGYNEDGWGPWSEFFFVVPGMFEGEIPSASSLFGALSVPVIQALVGDIVSESAIQGNLIGAALPLEGDLESTSTISGNLLVDPLSEFSGAIESESELEGALLLVDQISGSITSVSTLDAFLDLEDQNHLAGSMLSDSMIAGHLALDPLALSSHMSSLSQLRGRLRLRDEFGPGHPLPINSWIQYVQYGTEDEGPVNSGWMIFLSDQGYTVGSVNDRLFNFLRDEGYEGALSDMLYEFKQEEQIL